MTKNSVGCFSYLNNHAIVQQLFKTTKDV